jgi:hypothetical protein
MNRRVDLVRISCASAVAPTLLLLSHGPVDRRGRVCLAPVVHDEPESFFEIHVQDSRS